MPTRWVDNGDYFGPDRRRKPAKRWNDRRRLDEAGEPPPLGALLRRLRVRVAGPSAEDRRHALEMLKAAISEATRRGWRECAATLVNVDQLLRTRSGRDTIADADSLIVQAMDYAGAGR
jgi:hypothetical protein